MRNALRGQRLRNTALAAVILTGAKTVNADTLMTAETVMNEMPVAERFSYVAGIVEGLAYARLQKDTRASGENDQAGMNCIYAWYYQGEGQTHGLIEAAFRQYPQHFPATIVSVMIGQECGE